MAQIKSKQIKLVAEGDLILGNSSTSGSVLSIGTAGQILTSNGTTAAWGLVSNNGISLTEGDVFVGGPGDVATTVSATAQGQVLIAGAGPGFNFAPALLDASYITITPNSTNNITSTNVQAAINEIASEHSYVHSSTIDPTPDNDGIDTGSIGVNFKIGDTWINTATNNSFVVSSVTNGAAVWVRSAGVASAFVYVGNLNASNGGDALPLTPSAGDWYNINAVGGSNNFDDNWDAVGLPVGATFQVGDAVVYGSDGNWHKVDNTDPTIQGTAGQINVTGGPDTYTISLDPTQITPDQDLWSTIVADTGSTTANTTTDSLSIVGGAGISTSVALDVLTITNDSPNVDQNVWSTFVADTGTTSANTTSDIITIAGGVGISTALVGDVLTITSVGEPDQNLWETIAGDTGTTIANTSTDTLNVVGGVGISTSISGDTVTISTTGPITETKHSESVALGATNETIAGLFSEGTPVSNEGITVFFNGLALRDTAWTRTGTSLTLVDTVIGYSTDSGDIISVRYIV